MHDAKAAFNRLRPWRRLQLTSALDPKRTAFCPMITPQFGKLGI